MAQFEVSADLISSDFPFNFEETSNTIIVQSQYEMQQAAFRTNRGAESAAVEVIPHAYYMQNVLPHMRGYNSVHFADALPPHNFPGVRVDAVYTLRDKSGNTALFSPANDQNLVYDPNFDGWRNFPGAEVESVTVTNLKGVPYICYSFEKIVTYDFETGVFVDLTPDILGLDWNRIKGITSAISYLIAWDDETIYWSSATNPLDFVPSLITGAGSSSILAAKAQIITALPIADGWIAYTSLNAISATYSGIPGQPWIFREIPGSAGVGLPEHVNYESNQEVHVAWTSSGFQLVTPRAAEQLWPELSDAIAKSIYSEFGFEEFPETITGGAMLLKVSALGSRYTTISIRKSTSDPFRISYMYDWALRRWGRLDVEHADIIDFRAPEFRTVVAWEDLLETDTWDSYITNGLTWAQLGGVEADVATQFGKNFGVVAEDGRVFKCLPAQDEEAVDSEFAVAAEPRIIFGRYKRARQEDLILQEVQIRSDLLGPVWGYVHDEVGNLVKRYLIADPQFPQLESKFLTRMYAAAHSIEIPARFSIHAMNLVFTNGGTRNSPRNFDGDLEFLFYEDLLDQIINFILPETMEDAQ